MPDQLQIIRNIRQPVPALQAIERQTERAGAEEGQQIGRAHV